MVEKITIKIIVNFDRLWKNG